MEYISLREIRRGLVEILGHYLETKIVACWTTWIMREEGTTA